jgi:hypothetical protein
VRLAVLSILAATTLYSLPVFADDGGEAAEHEEHEPHHTNHVAIFVGGTTSLGDGSTTHFTLGADYEHRLPFMHELGVGVLIDSAIGSDATETLLAGFVAYHPIAGLMIYGGIGDAFTGFVKDGHLGLRGAAAYFMEVGKFSLGPEVSFDRVDGENAIVYGLSAGRGF